VSYPTTPQAAPTCYRHPDRATYVTCTRCHRPICPECMRSAAVGHQCEECVREGAKTMRQPQTGAGARQGKTTPVITYALIAINVVMFVLQTASPNLQSALVLHSPSVASGDWYRLVTSAFLHYGIAHLLFNMYALYITGPLVEQLYGSRLFVLFYLLCAAAGSVGSFVFGAGQFAVGASGAIFGLFGILLAASRTHHPVLDRRGRALVGQIGMLIVINLVIGFAVPRIDNAAHIGGLVAGLWLGFLIVPGRVPTIRRTAEQAAGGEASPSPVLPTLGVAALVAVLAIGVAVGTDKWQGPGRATLPPPVAVGTSTSTPDR
jgi:membrane associated rhomboid family serine protease